MDPPEKSGGSFPGVIPLLGNQVHGIGGHQGLPVSPGVLGLHGGSQGVSGLPMFGQNFSTHFLSGLQNFASQELVNKLQKMSQNAVKFGEFGEEEDKEEEDTEVEAHENKVYTDELKNMCEYTCQICGKIMNAYYLRKHVRDHNMSMTAYKELYGKVQFTKLSFHRCRICQNVIKANYITIMKHLKCVHNVSFKDYKKKFNIFVGKESKQMFKESEGELEMETDRAYSDKSKDMCKVLCKVCEKDYPTHQFRFHVKSKHNISFDDYRDLHGTLEINNRVYHRCKVCFKVLLFQYEKLASHVTDSHGLKMSAYVKLYLERPPARSARPPKKPREKKEKLPKVKTKTRKDSRAVDILKTERPRTRGKVKQEEGVEEKYSIQRELEILMNQEIGEVEESEEETRRSRRKKPRKKITRFRRRPKDEEEKFSVEDIKEEVLQKESDNTSELSSLPAVTNNPSKEDNDMSETNDAPRNSKNVAEFSNSTNSHKTAKTEDADTVASLSPISPSIESDTDIKPSSAIRVLKVGNSRRKKTTESHLPSLAVKLETKQAEMVFSDNPEEMCLCQCSFCNKVVPYDLLRKHVTSKHGKVKDDYGEYKYVRLTYHRCKKCNLEILFSYNNIKLHLNRFHKMSIIEYQQSMDGFSGKIVNLRTLKAMYEEEDGLREVKKIKVNSDRPLSDLTRSSGDRSAVLGPRMETVTSPEIRPREEEDLLAWYEGNVFSCKDGCDYSTVSLDRFEEHVRTEHRTSLSAYSGRYSSTGVSIQCEYCGDSVYHELRSIQHHLESHYLTIEQYQTHYLRSKIESEGTPSKVGVHEAAPLKTAMDASTSGVLGRMQDHPTSESSLLNQVFSETSALLDHLKRTELFRTSEKMEDHYSGSTDGYRSQDTAGFHPSHDHFRPFDDQVSIRGDGNHDIEQGYKTVDYGATFGRSLDGARSAEPFPCRGYPASTAVGLGLPIDYSQPVPHSRDAFPLKPDNYHLKDDYSPKHETEYSKPDHYSAKMDSFHNGKQELYCIKPTLYSPKEETFSPKSELTPSFPPLKNGEDYSTKMDRLVQTQKLSQENYFRYVTSQLHEFYNRRQGGLADFYDRESPRNPESFEPDYGGRQENGGNLQQPNSRGDIFGFRKEHF